MISFSPGSKPLSVDQWPHRARHPPRQFRGHSISREHNGPSWGARLPLQTGTSPPHETGATWHVLPSKLQAFTWFPEQPALRVHCQEFPNRTFFFFFQFTISSFAYPGLFRGWAIQTGPSPELHL